MYRFTRTAPECIILYAKYQRGPSRLYRTVRHYSKKPQPPPLADLCPPKRPKSHAARYWTLGALTLISGTIGYAKYDSEFRDWLVGLLPFMDGVIKFVFQEEMTYGENISYRFEKIKAAIMSALGFEPPISSREPVDIEEVPKDYRPPPQVLEPQPEKKCDEIYTEIRLQKKEKGEDEPSTEIVGDVRRESESSVSDIDIAELEKRAGETATLAIKGYNRALYALKNYNSDIDQIIEQSTIRINPRLQQSVKTKREARDDTLEKAEKCAAEAQQYINKLKYTLKYRSYEVPKVTREVVKQNIQKLEDDIKVAKKELDRERKITNITDKYWEKVEEARQHFAEDLQILFPSINLCEKKMNIPEEDLSLFLLHAYKVILFYQKELAKIETMTDSKLRLAIDNAKASGEAEGLSEQQIRQEVEKELRQLQMCFQKQCMQVKCETEDELRRQLKLQSEAFADHMKDALAAKEAEIERCMVKKFDEKMEAERCKFKLQLSAIVGRLRGLEHAIDARQKADEAAQNATILWSACQALFRSVKMGCPGLPWQEQVRSLATEIAAVKKAAVEGDELVDVVLKGLPREACERGVFTEDALRERFLKVEKMAHSLALVPEHGAPLPLHILSYIQSILLMKAVNPIPQAELNDEQVDFGSLGTIEILERARYWLDRNNFEQALRYMNLLQGAPRSVARQWMHETRILLETQQAANTLMAHAAACGLMYL